MNQRDLSAAQWHKSSHSTNSGGQCVEVAAVGGMVAVRDSKNPDGGDLVFGREVFRTLTRRLG